MYGKNKIPPILWAVVLCAIVLSWVLSPNFLLMSLLLLYIPFNYRFFFIKGQPNVIFWGLMFQWINVSAQAVYCTILGISINDLFAKTMFPAQLMEYTDFLSAAGIYAYSLGIFVAVRKLKIVLPDSIWKGYDTKKILQTYIIVSIIISVNQAAIWAFPTLVQYFFFFFYIKWGFFLLAFISVFKKAPELKIFLLAIIGFEFVLGLSSYFASSFSNILLFSLIGYSGVSLKISTPKVFLFVIMGCLLFHMAVLWTASKGSYRTYVNQGQNTQSVNVSKDAARAKLLELIVKVDAETYDKAVKDLVNRVGYIQYFAAAVRFVPARIPFEDGKVYGAAIGHYLVPRFINPDKEELDDSKHTNKYTGLGLSGKNQATSFSLGSFADAYIDFGPIYMFIPIFLFGLLVGTYFKSLFQPNLWGLVFTGPFFLLINIYGADTTKALGFMTIYFIVMKVFNKRIIKFVDPWMKKSEKN